MMTTGEINLLFTSVGRRVELLRAFRQAYKEEGIRGKVVATDVDPLAPALRVADCAHLVPRTDDPDFVPRLLEICKAENVKLVFPLVDPDILVLAASHQAFRDLGALAVVVPHHIAEATSDKWATYGLLRKLQVPVPRSWLGDQVPLPRGLFPLVVKPRFGSAGKNVFIASDEAQLQFFLGYVPHPIVQEFIDGVEITSDVVCDLSGGVLAVVSRERIEVRWGEVAKGKTIVNPTIIDYCVHIAEGLEAIGPITVQCIMRGEAALFTEVNARFGGGAPLGFAAGVRTPNYMLELASGLRPTVPGLGEYKAGLYLTRFDESLFLENPQHDFS